MRTYGLIVLNILWLQLTQMSSKQEYMTHHAGDLLLC